MTDHGVADALDADLPPIRPEFEAELRAELSAAWVQLPQPQPRPAASSLSRAAWVAAAAALAVVVGLAAWSQLAGQPRSVPGQQPSPSSSLLPVGPGTASDRYVIVVADGADVTNAEQPWFRFRNDGAIDGFDGCNWYTMTETGEVEGSAIGCDTLPVRPPLDAMSFVPTDAGVTIQADGFVAVAVDLLPEATAADLVGTWRVLGTDSNVRFTSSGLISIGSCFDVGTWTAALPVAFTFLQPSSVYECAASRFPEILTSGQARSRLDSEGTLWLSDDQLVVRLRPVEILEIGAPEASLFGFRPGLVDVDQLRTTISSALGAEPSETGAFLVACPTDDVRLQLGWDELTVDLLLQPDGMAILTAWTLGGGGPTGITTEAGIGIGSSYTDMTEAYPDVVAEGFDTYRVDGSNLRFRLTEGSVSQIGWRDCVTGP